MKQSSGKRLIGGVSDTRDIVTRSKHGNDRRETIYVPVSGGTHRVMIPEGFKRKFAGSCERGDLYYVEHSRSFAPCKDSHTFLGIAAKSVKLVITPISKNKRAV